MGRLQRLARHVKAPPTIAGAVGLCFLVAAGRACAQGSGESRVPIIGLPCEGCEAVFDGLPETLLHIARIAPADEPGEPMRIEGTVYDAGGEVAPGVIVYAYHTDARGVYPPDDRLRGAAARHGRLRGWAITDEHGRYRFDTVRPASYPNAVTPAHVHMHVIEVACCTYYLNSIRFEDDPRLTPEARKQAVEGRGGPALARPQRGDDGVWLVRRDILLGDGVPGYRSPPDPDSGV